MKHTILLLLSFLFIFESFAQHPKVVTAASIHESIQKLNFLGSALYVAAHPDDENNRMITYLANHIKANTTYLSLTRGDGGQNIIGPEIRELLGVIRTHEMLAARSIDGGHQLFSRANDFGYSKTPDETFNIWDRDEVLHDVVWAIRKLQPDIIINRFDHRTPGTTHGHHTASAISSKEAFALAANPAIFPEQLKIVQPYQPKRLFYNVIPSQIENGNIEKSILYPMDIGIYYPLKGKSNNEIAAESRSMHQCQGMGTTAHRGSYLEYMELIDGSKPTNNMAIFSGINTSWSRLKNGKAIQTMLEKVESNFSYQNPAASLSDLLNARKLIRKLEDGIWKQTKLSEIEQIFVDCTGLFMEATTKEGAFVIGDEIEINLELVNRSMADITLESIQFTSTTFDSFFQTPLTFNEPFKMKAVVDLSQEMRMSNAYWLNQKSTQGMYKVDDLSLLGLPATPRELIAIFNIKVNGVDVVIKKDVVRKYTDRVVGEIYQPLEITPPVFVNIDQPVYLFPNEKAQTIDVKITAGKSQLRGVLNPGVANGWKVKPTSIPFSMNQKGEEQTFSFQLTPPNKQAESFMQPTIEIDGQIYQQSINEISYPHIPRQLVLLKAKAKTVRVDLKTYHQKIGYLQGTGDVVPECLQQIGYDVQIIEEEQINKEALKEFSAIVVGIRAYNVREKLKFQQDILMDYVEAGGTLIVQYNTNHALYLDSPGPYPLSLSRDRVTVEEAPVEILEPMHELMTKPNKITAKDFDNWVQERGLYFPNEWDEKYTPILSSFDPGESQKKGGLLYAKYGKGHFVYTGYSWFRQLPAGVPGAYRIFANMLSVGKSPQP